MVEHDPDRAASGDTRPVSGGGDRHATPSEWAEPDHLRRLAADVRRGSLTRSWWEAAPEQIEASLRSAADALEEARRELDEVCAANADAALADHARIRKADAARVAAEARAERIRQTLDECAGWLKEHGGKDSVRIYARVVAASAGDSGAATA